MRTSAFGQKLITCIFVLLEVLNHLITVSKFVMKPVDLDDSTSVEEQKLNAKRFRKPWLVTIGTGLCFFVAGYIGSYLAPNSSLPILIGMPFGIVCILSGLIWYKCPACKRVPPGTFYSIGSSEVSYNKGIHPFPSRCAHCGAYLSTWALNRDLKRLFKKRMEPR